MFLSFVNAEQCLLLAVVAVIRWRGASPFLDRSVLLSRLSLSRRFPLQSNVASHTSHNTCMRENASRAGKRILEIQEGYYLYSLKSTVHPSRRDFNSN